MRTRLFYIVIFAFLLVSCEEYYTPKLDVVPGLMVVESRLTNDPNQNFVKLSRTLDFYNTGSQKAIVGAKVELIEVGGPTIKGVESGTGYFKFPKTPVAGKKYLLRITNQTDIFESDPVIMPPMPSIDTLYTNHKILKSYRTDAFGGPTQVETPGREICIDAPIKSTLEYYKFKWRAIIQWEYQAVSALGPPPAPVYGWISYYQSGLFNIAGSKEFSVSDQVKNHSILFLGYDTRAYLDSTAQVPMGWIVIIDQYGIPKESYDFQEKLNKQFLAEGSLFDPVLTQVTGNIHCKSHPEQIVVGFFDMNSYRQYRYFMSIGSGENSKVYQRRMNRYLEISDRDTTLGKPPVFWENF